MKENGWVTFGRIVAVITLLSASGDTVRNAQARVKPGQTPEFTPAETFTPTPPPTDTETPTSTPSPTETPTLTPFPSETPSKTPQPDNEANMKLIEQSLEGEQITLENVTITKVVVTNARFKELIGGQILQNGKMIVIKNFDCEFTALRDQGLLGDVQQRDNPMFPTRVWETGDVRFDEITVQRGADLTPEVTMLTSESFKLGDTEKTCEEEPVLGPAQNMIDQAWEFVTRLLQEAQK